MRAAVLIAGAAAVYAGLAWLAPPGVYDGEFSPPPYRWVSPPPQFASANQAPQSGERRFGVVAGKSQPGTAFTADGQASLSLVPGSYAPVTGMSAVTVRITPEHSFPDPGSVRFASNVYLITCGAPLVKEALVTLMFTDGIPSPSEVYFAAGADKPWERLAATPQPALNSISTRTMSCGYFAAGYPPGAFDPSRTATLGGGQILPITVAGLILLVLAGTPLIRWRERRRKDTPD